ncbi:MAG: hypothetical protein HZA31_00800 [Opitutae bacterium]|nr:hypothetical protein [Opitutae bacterium]
MLRRLLPAEFQGQFDVPAKLILHSQNAKNAISREVIDEMVRKDRNTPNARRPDMIGVMPNLRLNDRDSWLAFVFLDEKRATESIACTPSHVRALLEARTPQLPLWFIAGFVQLFYDAEFFQMTLTLRGTQWTTEAHTRLIARNPAYPHALLPFEEMLAVAPRIAANNQPANLQLWRKQAALFIRWALEEKIPGRADAFWKFLERTCAEPATENLFREHFGFGYADAEDRLSDYLPAALRRPISFVALAADEPNIKLRLASAGEIARIKGDWERLEVGYVQIHFPMLASKYREQALRTLEHGRQLDSTDPQLLAALGLLYCDDGNDATALPYLEAAAKAKIVRPRVYYELARNYLRAWTAQGVSNDGKISVEQAARLLELLSMARAQAPQLPEVYQTMCAVWDATNAKPTYEDLAVLEAGARMFPQNTSLPALAAAFYLRHGHTKQAAALIDFGLALAPYAEGRESLVKVRNFLTKTP